MYDLEFHPDAEDEIYELEPEMLAKALKQLEKLEAKGPELRYPDTDKVKDGLFELRAGKKDISRNFFCVCQRPKDLHTTDIREENPKDAARRNKAGAGKAGGNDRWQLKESNFRR